MIDGREAQIAPLCVDVDGLAALLGVSPRTVYRLDDSGRIPAAIELGSCKRWYVREVEDWLAAGAPRRQQWNLLRRSAS